MIKKGIIISGLMEVKLFKSKEKITIFGIIHLFSLNSRTYKGILYESDKARPFISDYYTYDKDKNTLIGDKSEINTIKVDSMEFDLDSDFTKQNRQDEARIKDEIKEKIRIKIGKDFYSEVRLIGREYKTNKGVIDFVFASNESIYIVEVKIGTIKIEDIRQLEGYISELSGIYQNKKIFGIMIGNKEYQGKKYDYLFYSLNEFKQGQ